MKSTVKNYSWEIGILTSLVSNPSLFFILFRPCPGTRPTYYRRQFTDSCRHFYPRTRTLSALKHERTGETSLPRPPWPSHALDPRLRLLSLKVEQKSVSAITHSSNHRPPLVLLLQWCKSKQNIMTLEWSKVTIKDQDVPVPRILYIDAKESKHHDFTLMQSYNQTSRTGQYRWQLYQAMQSYDQTSLSHPSNL